MFKDNIETWQTKRQSDILPQIHRQSQRKGNNFFTYTQSATEVLISWEVLHFSVCGCRKITHECARGLFNEQNEFYSEVGYRNHCLQLYRYLGYQLWWVLSCPKETVRITSFTDLCAMNFFVKENSVCFHFIDYLFDLGS